MNNTRKDLPPIGAPNFNERLRETVSTYLGNRGNKLDRGLTVRDLVDAGLVRPSSSFLAGGSGNPIAAPGPAIAAAFAYTPDLTPPPTPSGFYASASATSIQIVTDPQTYLQGHGHAKTQVFGAKYSSGALPVFSDAVMLGEFSGDVFAFPVDPASTYRLWIKWVTVDGQVSAQAGGTNGVAATTSLLDDTQISFLTASKIRSGSVSVGQYIQSAGYVAGTSGWRINGDGTAEFSDVVVRGGVYTSYGQIGGNTIDSTGMQSPGYVVGSAGWRLDNGGVFYANSVSLRGQITGGAFRGYGWPTAGTGDGFYLGSSGLLLGNYNNGQYFQVTAAGRVLAPGLDINSGVATFSGAVSGATISTNSGLFSVNSAGKLTAIEADIQRRVVIQTGIYNPGGSANGTSSTDPPYSLPTGSVIALNPPTGILIATDIYDSYLTTTGTCQKFGVSLHAEGSTTYYGGTGNFQFSGTAEAVVCRTYSVGGVNTTNDSRVYILITNLYCTLLGIVGYVYWPTFRWKLYKL